MKPVPTLSGTMLIKLFILLLSIYAFISPIASTNDSQNHGEWYDHPPSTEQNQTNSVWRLMQGSKCRSLGGYLVVAKDGSGNFTTIQEAVNFASSKRAEQVRGRITIHVKAGVYDEIVRVGKDLKNLTLEGEGIGKTIITGNRSKAYDPITETATVGVKGDGFMATGITFRNTAGPNHRRAIALQSKSDLSVFYNCSFEGYQETLLVATMRQFYRECRIYGTVDFIYGDASVVFQKCEIIVRRGVPTQDNFITAQKRVHASQTTGISIHDSKVVPAPELKPFLHQHKTYLGRPWTEYSRTVFMRTYLDSFIDPKGWLPMEGTENHKTAYYGEYENYGPGAWSAGRVKWPGYHVMNYSEASQFTVENFIQGNAWLNSTKVPFNAGL